MGLHSCGRRQYLWEVSRGFGLGNTFLGCVDDTLVNSVRRQEGDSTTSWQRADVQVLLPIIVLMVPTCAALQMSNSRVRRELSRDIWVIILRPWSSQQVYACRVSERCVR